MLCSSYLPLGVPNELFLQAISGLGVLHLEKFAMALRLRWPWLEWKNPDKIWVGLGNPCCKADMAIFYAATTITVEMGPKPLFGVHLGFMVALQSTLPP
jgi:hypothetical protein